MAWRPLALALVLVVPSVLASDWTQAGHDAGRSAATPASGAVTDDISFYARPPSGQSGGLFAVGDDLFATAVHRPPPPATDPTIGGTLDVVRVSTRDGSNRTILQRVPAPFTEIATDGSVLVVPSADAVRAYALDDGALRWTTPYPAVPPGVRAPTGLCRPPAIAAGVVFLLCDVDDASGYYAGNRIVTLAISLADGRILWWTAEVATTAQVLTQSGYALLAQSVAIAIAGSRVLTLAQDPGQGDQTDEIEARDANTGNLLWERNETVPEEVAGRDPLGGVPVQPANFGVSLSFIATPSLLFTYTNAVTARNVATGDVVWSRTIPLGPDTAALALAGDTLFVANGGQELRCYHALSGSLVWNRTIDNDRDLEAIQVAGRSLFVGEVAPTTNSQVDAAGSGAYLATTILRLDASNGATLWRHELGSQPLKVTFPWIVDDAALAMLRRDGNMTVLGSTPVSIGPAITVSTIFPSARGDVRVDARGTRAGLQDPSIHLRADWGDGSVDEYQDALVLNHRYNASGDQLATFYFANDAGQTARITQVFHVGASPPSSPNFLATAFANENQNLTFFVLGLLITALIGAFGLGRGVARRRRLRAEIRAVDEGVRGAPDARAFLSAARTRARALVLAGKLDEAQFTVLAKHIDDVERAGAPA